jgi:uncharacterized protein
MEFFQNVRPGDDWQEFQDKYHDPDRFVAYLHTNGVDYGVVLAELCPATTGVCHNESVIKFCAGQSSLIPFASINPFMVPSAKQELKRLANSGFRGLKLYPTYQQFYPNDSLLYPLYAEAESLQIPIMFHTGSSVFKGSRLKYGDPIYLDDVAVDFPDLRIILAHGGRGFWYQSAFFLAKLHKNVYIEVAGLPPQKLLEYFPELERAADKVLFGTDWPGIQSIKGNIDAIRALPLTKDAKEKILGQNAAKLLGLPI